ncbi:MAG: transcriptional repressor NrdR [Thermoguttaceae bacterium]|nr:transcriptional repressor NrdR [Thermoguttaceae bacterium]MBQ1864160.1 transcriptional repressor NrdR [Thermoguttaceae bacterium]MBQ2038013.1 transcriptional repressor NrdR [Thermoguttaceae bacterium]MBQ2555742.1 transcriptional repressor NrdR [Thermoguttaceae bacterium]MBQ3822103.1 transcriptional repressor NrdR [Thermoguttaceae bacterium]
MKCPFCHKDNDRVVETRTSDDGFLVRRRRVCQSCNRRFTTYERIEVGNLRVIKRDGARVPFDRDKIREGVERACWKRPVREAQISELVAELETSLEGETEVESQRIGEMTMALLRKIDEIAYVRFASVYRKFNTAQDFTEILRAMAESNAAGRE